MRDTNTNFKAIVIIIFMFFLFACGGQTGNAVATDKPGIVPESSAFPEQIESGEGQGDAGNEETGIQPYGINNWQWPSSTCALFDAAHINRYRIMVAWRAFEQEAGKPIFEGPESSSLFNALRCASELDARVSLVIYRAPSWAMDDVERTMSYDPTAYANFITAILTNINANYPGIVEAVEIENETPTNPWKEGEGPVYNTDQRDPSYFYINILKAGSEAVRAFDRENGTNTLVIMDGIWEGAYHHLDELYQLGCSDCFDRINFHYYLLEQSSTDQGKPQDPMDTTTIWHYPTVLAYLNYIARDNGDGDKPVWLTEFGWRYPLPEGNREFANFTPDENWETLKAQYVQAVLDVSRDSGFVERTNLYVGSVTPLDTMSLLYVGSDREPERHLETALYQMYMSYGEIYPSWAGEARAINPIPAASSDLELKNGDFEDGVLGWEGIEPTNEDSHSGNNAGRITFDGERLIKSDEYPIETGRLYEISFWVNISAENPQAAMAIPQILQSGCGEDSSRWRPPNYFGVVDTGQYPDNWRRIRFPYVAGECVTSISVGISVSGVGDLLIDDVKVIALDLGD